MLPTGWFPTLYLRWLLHACKEYFSYTLPQNLSHIFFVDRLRFFVMAENSDHLDQVLGLSILKSLLGGTSLGVTAVSIRKPRTWTIGKRNILMKLKKKKI